MELHSFFSTTPKLLPTHISKNKQGEITTSEGDTPKKYDGFIAAPNQSTLVRIIEGPGKIFSIVRNKEGREQIEAVKINDNLNEKLIDNKSCMGHPWVKLTFLLQKVIIYKYLNELRELEKILKLCTEPYTPRLFPDSAPSIIHQLDACKKNSQIKYILHNKILFLEEISNKTSQIVFSSNLIPSLKEIPAILNGHSTEKKLEMIRTLLRANTFFKIITTLKSPPAATPPKTNEQKLV